MHIADIPSAEVTDLSLDERLIVEEAWQAMKLGNTEKAIKLLTQLHVENPFHYAGLGYAYYVQNDLPRAEGYFKAAITEHPNNILGHLGLGQIYQETGREDEAFTEFREVLKRDPDYPWVLSRYGEIKSRKTQEALYDGKTLTAGGDIAGAKTSYLKALYYSPEATEAHLALAQLYLREDNHADALVHLKAARNNEPENIEILETYADALFQSNNNPKSMELYEKILELDPANQVAQERIETLKNRLGIFELPSQYDAIPAADSVTREQMSALISVKFRDILPDPSRKPPIMIDISTSWATRHILKTATLGILEVYSNHTFQPQKVVTRAELAEILFRLINQLEKLNYRFIQQIPPERIQITDVSSDNFYYRPIVMMVSYDVMSLELGRKFNPELAVSGQEAIRHLNLILALIR
jgi:tetratricopeptide (TPR) repeat protein